MSELISKDEIVAELATRKFSQDAKKMNVSDMEMDGFFRGYVEGMLIFLPKTTEQEIRNNAIEEFAERLKRYYQSYDIDLCLQDNDHLSYTNSRIALESYIDEIAESMKGGK